MRAVGTLSMYPRFAHQFRKVRRYTKAFRISLGVSNIASTSGAMSVTLTSASNRWPSFGTKCLSMLLRISCAVRGLISGMWVR